MFRLMDQLIDFVNPLVSTITLRSKAAADVIEERFRQLVHEGNSPEHDDAYSSGTLADAAVSYIAPAVALRFWPWDLKELKRKNRRYDLVRAAALIIAEIERLDRLSDRFVGETFDNAFWSV